MGRASVLCSVHGWGIQKGDDVPHQSRLDTAKRDILSVTPPKHNIWGHNLSVNWLLYGGFKEETSAWVTLLPVFSKNTFQSLPKLHTPDLCGQPLDRLDCIFFFCFNEKTFCPLCLCLRYHRQLVRGRVLFNFRCDFHKNWLHSLKRPSAEDMKQPFNHETLFSLLYSLRGFGPCYFLISTISASRF